MPQTPFTKQTVPAEWLRLLLRMEKATHLEAFVRAVQGLVHSAMPPLRAVGMLFHPFEWQFPLMFCEPGEEEEWKKWLDCAVEEDIWLHRWRKYGKPGSQSRVVRHTDHTPDDILVRSKIYRKLMRGHRIRFGGGLLVWEKDHLLALVQFLRSTEHGDFTDAEMRVMRQLYPHIEVGVRRFLKEHREYAARLTLEQFIDGSEVAMIMLDWDLKIIHHNDPAREAAHRWIHGEARARSLKAEAKLKLPADLRAGCEEFRASFPKNPVSLKGEIANQVRAHPNRPGWLCRLECFRGRPLSHPVFLLRLETPFSKPTKTPVRNGAVTEKKLTPREREIAAHVCAGRTNREIAAALGKSEATVRNQLHAIFEKLEVSRRAELIVRGI